MLAIPGFTKQQQQAAELYAHGYEQPAIAKALSVPASTLDTWEQDPRFVEYIGLARDRLVEDLLQQARVTHLETFIATMDAIKKLVKSPKTDPELKVKAARAIPVPMGVYAGKAFQDMPGNARIVVQYANAHTGQLPAKPGDLATPQGQMYQYAPGEEPEEIKQRHTIEQEPSQE